MKRKDIELSKRGKFLLLFPIYLFGISILLREPYIGILGISIFSLFLYARYEIAKIPIDVDDNIPQGNKTVDEPFTIKNTIKSDRSLPVVLSAEPNDEFDLVEKEGLEEERRTGTKVSYRLVPKSRGYQKIGKIHIKVNGSLRLYEKTTDHQIQEEVIVHSSKEAMKKAQTYARRTHTEELMKSSIQFTSRSNEFEGIREYQPGDSLRDIHWKSLSKFQTMMTKVYEKLAPVGAHILLDCSPPMRRRLPDGRTKLEQAIYVSLEILKNFEILGHDIGMTAYDHKEVHFHQDSSSEKIAFRNLYEKVNELPGAVEQKEISLERYQDAKDLSSLDEEEKLFSEKLSRFISGIKQDQIGGILSAVNQIKSAGDNRKLVIIISDMEMNPQATVRAVEHLKGMQHTIWLVIPFSPWYEVEEVDEKILEKAYKEYEKLENIIQRLRKLETSIFELHPEKEGFMILEEWEKKKT
ncbi:MAG: DUF58 domain-containing protein [Candidatus Natronoplasma sp.]